MGSPGPSIRMSRLMVIAELFLVNSARRTVEYHRQVSVYHPTSILTIEPKFLWETKLSRTRSIFLLFKIGKASTQGSSTGIVVLVTSETRLSL